MSYSVYFKYETKTYKLPVNPEEIKRSRELQVETFQVLKTGQVSVAAGCGLEEYSFEAEFPSHSYHYVESGAEADADHYEKMFHRVQKNRIPVRFIASNGINDDLSVKVLIKSMEVVEKAGEEGDKYISLKLMEYRKPGKRYEAVQISGALVKKEAEQTETERSAVEKQTHIVQPGDTLWGLAKRYYGNGEQYPKILAANPEIGNPNLIYSGQVLRISE